MLRNEPVHCVHFVALGVCVSELIKNRRKCSCFSELFSTSSLEVLLRKYLHSLSQIKFVYRFNSDYTLVAL